jgi:phosphoglycolate phosphatase
MATGRGDARPLVVCDLDGTLVDSRRDLAQATNRLIATYGGLPLAEAAVVRMVGDGAEQLVARAFRASGLQTVPPGALPRFLAIYADGLLDHTTTYPGVPEALEALSGIASLAVLTNKPRVLSMGILEGLGLASCFAYVLGGDGSHVRKPDPAGLVWLMRACGVGATRTLLVGDSVVDLRTARAAGVRLALVRYGFGFADIPAGEWTGSEHVVDTPADLVELVRTGF